jgi:hypothetical protein
MCILCAGLAGDEHWTDAVAGRADAAVARRRRTVGAVLGAYGLVLHGQLGGMATVADRKGGARVVRGLGELWPAAETLARRPLDPLDAELLERLENA